MMIPLSYGLILSFILFILGFTGIIINRNLLFILISLEIMMNSSALAFVISSNYWGSAEGQIMYILIITLAAAETSIGLSLLLRIYYHYQTLDIDIFSEIYK